MMVSSSATLASVASLTIISVFALIMTLGVPLGSVVSAMILIALIRDILNKS